MSAPAALSVAITIGALSIICAGLLAAGSVTRAKTDGAGLRRLSVSKDGDYLPHTLQSGLIAYTRWEYQELKWANIQSIWTIRPDGTGARIGRGLRGGRTCLRHG